ncbi:ribonuclease H-like domain-containing protein [Tanacetum coccineum]
MESYFQKIDFIVTILTSLDARVNDEDVVHYALEGLPDKYNQMRLKSKALALPVDSSSPMVLVAKSSTNSRSSTSKGKSWKPCFNFAKGFCRYGDSCRYAHDANARVSNANSGFNKGRGTSENTTHDLLNKLLVMNVAMSNNGTNVTLPNPATVTPTVTGPNIASTVPTTPHAFYASLGSAPLSSVVNTSGQATLLPQAFTARTLHDPTIGAWNMDTGVSSHLNNYVTSLSTILNSCMYSTVSVGDGHSVSVTNTGHNILSTPLNSLRLNNFEVCLHCMIFGNSSLALNADFAVCSGYFGIMVCSYFLHLPRFGTYSDADWAGQPTLSDQLPEAEYGGVANAVAKLVGVAESLT